MGMMVVKPKNMPRSTSELWMTQEEYYLGKPGAPADMAKLKAETPDVFAFNGYANQYKDAPITVKKGEKIRMYVLDAGPSKWSAFHVIGTVFDKAVVEDTRLPRLADDQPRSVAGRLGRVHARPGGQLPVRHARFGDMAKGARRHPAHRRTPPRPPPRRRRPAGEPGHDHATMHGQARRRGDTVNVEMGDMFIKADTTSIKAGDVTFAIKNTGATMHAMAIGDHAGQGRRRHARREPAAEQGQAADGRRVDHDRRQAGPGSYELVCYVPGHYAAGQKLAFQVK